MSFTTFVKNQNYIPELSVVEHIILWLNVACSLAFFIAQLSMGDFANPSLYLSFVASFISIFAVMAGAKKKIICPFLGIVASIFLIALAWFQHVYGSLIMYGINIVMQIWSFVTWYKSSKNKINIQPKDVKWWIALLYLLIFVGLTALFTWVESIPGFVHFWSGNPQAVPEELSIRIFDSANLMFTLACFIPMVKRYDKVWYTYIISDLAICCLWLTKGILAPTVFTNWTMFISGLCMTITCFLGLINWQKSKIKTNKIIKENKHE